MPVIVYCSFFYSLLLGCKTLWNCFPLVDWVLLFVDKLVLIILWKCLQFTHICLLIYKLLSFSHGNNAISSIVKNNTCFFLPKVLGKKIYIFDVMMSLHPWFPRQILIVYRKTWNAPNATLKLSEGLQGMSRKHSFPVFNSYLSSHLSSEHA